MPTTRTLLALSLAVVSACNPNARPPARAGAVGMPGGQSVGETPQTRYLYWLDKGKAAYKASKYKDAIRHFQKAERNQKTAKIAVWIGDTYAVQGGSRNWKPALKAYDAALGRDPRVLGARLGKAWYHLTLPRPDPDAAMALIQEEEALKPGRSEVADARRKANGLITARGQQQRGREAAEARRAEAERQKQESKAKLQKKMWEVGKVQCQVVAYGPIGKTFGHEFASVTASGLFVSALMKCTNKARKTKQVHSTNFTLVDGAGNQYAGDSKGSYYYAINNEAAHHKNPEFLQLHPGVGTYIGLVFDVPTAVAETDGLQLDFKTARFPLWVTQDLRE